MKLDELREKVKNCLMGGDPTIDVKCSEALMRIKVNVRDQYVDILRKAEQEEARLSMSDEVTCGKNEKVREAALLMAKSKCEIFDQLQLAKQTLAIIGDVERHNDTVVAILYRSNK